MCKFQKKCVFAESKVAFVFDIYKNKRRFFSSHIESTLSVASMPSLFQAAQDSAWFITERKDNKKSMGVTEAFLGNCYVNVMFYLAITNHLRAKIAPFAEIFLVGNPRIFARSDVTFMVKGKDMQKDVCWFM